MDASSESSVRQTSVTDTSVMAAVRVHRFLEIMGSNGGVFAISDSTT
jgi:hypothetical protein